MNKIACAVENLFREITLYSCIDKKTIGVTKSGTNISNNINYLNRSISYFLQVQLRCLFFSSKDTLHVSCPIIKKCPFLLFLNGEKKLMISCWLMVRAVAARKVITGRYINQHFSNSPWLNFGVSILFQKGTVKRYGTLMLDETNESKYHIGMFLLSQLLLFYREHAILNNSLRLAYFGKEWKLCMDSGRIG